MISLHDSLDSSPDLLGPLQVAGGDALPELLQFLARPFHGLFPLRLLVAAPLVGVDDEDAQRGIPRRDLLRPGAQGMGLSFLGVDATGAVDPLRVVDGREPGIEPGIAPPLDPDEEPMMIFRD